MIRRISVILGTLAILLLLGATVFISSRSVGAVNPASQTQFFHREVGGNSLPDSSTTIITSIPFKISQRGALNFVGLQCVFFFVGAKLQRDNVTATVSLDGTTIATISVGNQTGAIPYVPVDITTTHAVMPGTHVLILQYRTSEDTQGDLIHTPPITPNTMDLGDGTVSMEVTSLATSN